MDTLKNLSKFGTDNRSQIHLFLLPVTT